MKNSNKILFIIFFITVIPTVYVYQDHGNEEIEASNNTPNDYKKTKALGEGILFLAIAWGYGLTTLGIVFLPKSRIPYIILIVGTVAVILVWLFRIFGIPIPFTDIVIRDLSTDYRDVITKSCQVIMLPVLTLLAMRRRE